jgi:hypothetical protein
MSGPKSPGVSVKPKVDELFLRWISQSTVQASVKEWISDIKAGKSLQSSKKNWKDDFSTPPLSPRPGRGKREPVAPRSPSREPFAAGMCHCFVA